MYNFYYICIMTPHKKLYTNKFYYHDLETGYLHGNLFKDSYAVGIGHNYKEKQKGFWLNFNKI